MKCIICAYTHRGREKERGRGWGGEEKRRRRDGGGQKAK